MYNRGQEWFKGYLILEVTGKQLERLINLSTAAGITVWNIHRFGNDYGKMNILLEDFFRLRPLLKKTDCRVHIKERVGFPFLGQKIKRRFAFLLGVFLFVISMLILSNIVWQVDIVGNDKVEKDEILELAEEIGIKKGVLKYTLPPIEQAQRFFSRELEQASWVGVEIRGTRVVIRVVEKVVPEKEKPLNPRHLVAAKRAVIHNIFVERGQQKVQVNQVVNKGDILISGIVGNENNYRIVPAKGKVMGEVWYETEIRVPLKQNPVSYTGKKHENFYLLIGSYALKIKGYDEIPFTDYKTNEEKTYLKWRDYRIPLGWKKEVMREKRGDFRKLTLEEALELGKKMARQDVLRRVEDGRIKEEKVLHHQVDSDKVYIKMHFAVIEDIAVEQTIIDQSPFEEENNNKHDQ